jgi:hypothetical protein
MEICNRVAISLYNQIYNSNRVQSNKSGVWHHFIAIREEELRSKSKNAEIEEPDSLMKDSDKEWVGH